MIAKHPNHSETYDSYASGSRSTLRRHLILMAIIIVYGIAMVMADWWSVQPNGSHGPKAAAEAVMICSLIAMIGVSYCWFVPFRWMRWTASTITILALGFLFVSFPARSIGQNLRIGGFKKVAAVGDDIATAIAKFTEETGHPPSSLDELLPIYIEHIPSTGLAAYPAFNYQLNESRGTWRITVIVTPGVTSSGIESGALVYFSEKNYPKSWKPVENWALSGG